MPTLLLLPSPVLMLLLLLPPLLLLLPPPPQPPQLPPLTSTPLLSPRVQPRSASGLLPAVAVLMSWCCCAAQTHLWMW
jgi:hypothetical protein